MTSPRAPHGSGKGRVGIVENWELRGKRQQDANSGAFKGLAFLLVAIVLIVIGGWYAARPMVGPAMTGLFEESPSIVRLPIIDDLLAAEFSDRLDTAASTSDEEVEFVIEASPNPTIDSVAAALAEAGLLEDELAFRYAMVVNRVDELLKPGTYTMTRQFTPQEVATRLASDPDVPTPMTVLDMRHGRRIEQVVAYLQQQTEKTELELEPKAFLRLARNPSSAIIGQYDFLKQLPEGNNLEGFLYGGTYEVPVDITAEELIYLMLDEWESEAGSFVAQARKKDIDFYDALIIASLVEREAKVDGDRAKIAGVYWNRLNPKVNKQTNGLLQADPTVVYATDSMALEDLAVKKWDTYVFWDLLGRSDYSTVDVDKKYQSFQTYQSAGLPDWPIASASAKSLEAALNPITKTKNLYFYACPGSDKHKFAKTAKQHNKNISSCN